MKILVTGGAGFIGSTICSALQDVGMTPVIIDSFVSGQHSFTKGRLFHEGDIGDPASVSRALALHPDITCVVHCAALIVVPESVADPARYYDENVSKSLAFLRCLKSHGITKVIFSSSASLYAETSGGSVDESSEVDAASPYARSKLMTEWILADFARAYGMRTIALRYFNPIGADPAMRTGQYISRPSHALGKLVEVFLGREPEFVVAGNDWPTHDGSTVRDYIHVWDLAQAHVRAVQAFEHVFETTRAPRVGMAKGTEGFRILNLGTGRGCTVFELIRTFETLVGRPLPWRIGPRRVGDIAGAFANPELAHTALGWRAQLSVADGIADALRWDERRRTLTAPSRVNSEMPR